MKPNIKPEENISGFKILEPPSITLGLTRTRKRSSLPPCLKRASAPYPVVNLSRPFSSPLLPKKTECSLQKNASNFPGCRLLTNFPLKIGLSTPSRKKRGTTPQPTNKSPDGQETVISEELQFRGWDPNDADCTESEKRRSQFVEFIDRINRVCDKFTNSDNSSSSCDDISGSSSCDSGQISCLDPPKTESPIFVEKNHDVPPMKNCHVILSRIASLDAASVAESVEKISNKDFSHSAIKS